MTHRETAQAFFEACETGQGWETCKTWCAADATFSCQADALAETKTLAAYCDWMQGLLTPIPGDLGIDRFCVGRGTPNRCGDGKVSRHPDGRRRTRTANWQGGGV